MLRISISPVIGPSCNIHIFTLMGLSLMRLPEPTYLSGTNAFKLMLCSIRLIGANFSSGRYSSSLSDEN